MGKLGVNPTVYMFHLIAGLGNYGGYGGYGTYGAYGGYRPFGMFGGHREEDSQFVRQAEVSWGPMRITYTHHAHDSCIQHACQWYRNYTSCIATLAVKLFSFFQLPKSDRMVQYWTNALCQLSFDHYCKWQTLGNVLEMMTRYYSSLVLRPSHSPICLVRKLTVFQYCLQHVHWL